MIAEVPLKTSDDIAHTVQDIDTRCFFGRHSTGSKQERMSSMSHIGLIARHSTLTDTSVPGNSEHHPCMFNTRRPEQHFCDCSGRIPILSTFKERNIFYFHWIRRVQDSRKFKRNASQRGPPSKSRDFKEKTDCVQSAICQRTC